MILVIHAKELKRTTNTGRLALHGLVNSEMCVRGESHEALDLSPILKADKSEIQYDSFLFYPSDDALELSEVVAQRENRLPIQLIVPDGNWRQASKVASRHPELRNIPRVKISAPNLAVAHLRKEHFAEGMSTLEAIALALGIIEGQHVRDQLMVLYEAKLAATLRGRGQLPAVQSSVGAWA